MAEIVYKIEIFEDWHAGSGLSAGADVDLLVIKDADNFPFIPGKTLKGLLKNGAMDLADAGVLDYESIHGLFGEDAQASDNRREEHHSRQGKFYFSNAELTRNVKQKLRNKTHILYRKISSTAIEQEGQAREKSLRRIEMAVPLVLFAKIDHVENKEQLEILEKCMKMVKRLGSWRNRGYGRCAFSIVDGGAL
ncbi:MAG: CRISPR-associated protein [Calditrichaeota bacterium]|nr:MAG: CRISPR-associated protein [Calditrichota bacterium]